MDIPKLTLDTNLLIEYWKRQKKMDIVENLLELAKLGKVDLAVTRRIRQDIPKPELSNRLNDLPELQIAETGSIARFGYWLLDGREMLGDETFNDFLPTAAKLATQRGETPPDWRDWDHLHAHYLLKRDVFLTWDNGIICLSKELKDKFDINVISPDEYLESYTTT
jgi:predicted nucleic acid-binding protein